MAQSAGGLIGALVGAGIPEEDARTYETHVKEGRILITAQATTRQQAQAARDVFDRYGGSDVRAYDRSASADALARLTRPLEPALGILIQGRGRTRSSPVLPQGGASFVQPKIRFSIAVPGPTPRSSNP